MIQTLIGSWGSRNEMFAFLFMVLARFYLQQIHQEAKQIEASIFSVSLPKKWSRLVVLGGQAGFGDPINRKHEFSLLLVFTRYQPIDHITCDLILNSTSGSHPDFPVTRYNVWNPNVEFPTKRQCLRTLQPRTCKYYQGSV